MLRLPGWQTAVILIVLALGTFMAFPNMYPRDEALPSAFITQRVNLGLDLEGGAYLLLRVDTSKAELEFIETVQSSTERSLRALGIEHDTSISEDGSTLTVWPSDPADIAKVRTALLQVEQRLDLSQDDMGVTAQIQSQALATRKDNLVRQSIEIIRRRVDPDGLREPSIQRQGKERILIQLPGVSGKELEIIKERFNQPGKLYFAYTHPELYHDGGRVPAVYDALPGNPKTHSEFELERKYLVSKRKILDGKRLENAQPDYNDGIPVVAFRFDTTGAKRFCDETTKSVGKLFAIVLDGEVLSAPRIQSAICQGSGIITGNFTVDTARELAVLIRAGALPAPLILLEERTVGAGLGADSIKAGIAACLIGLALVLILMMIMYGVYGFFANMALLVNLILIAGLLSLLQATLTLPGIAGIVLTIGMAVDANVLVFERIREEFRTRGKVASAIRNGYDNAWSTIRDANLTTLIGAVLLYAFGSGPVKGFAVTLALGIGTSMFTALLFTRMLIGWYMDRRSDKETLPIQGREKS